MPEDTAILFTVASEILQKTLLVLYMASNRMALHFHGGLLFYHKNLTMVCVEHNIICRILFPQ